MSTAMEGTRDMTITNENYVFTALAIGSKYKGLFETWETTLTAVELAAFGLLMGWLILQRGVAPDVVSDAIPQRLDSLPFQGCEQGWMQVIIDQMHQRGKTDEEIGQFARGMVSLITEAQQFDCQASSTETAA